MLKVGDEYYTKEGYLVEILNIDDGEYPVQAAVYWPEGCNVERYSLKGEYFMGELSPEDICFD